MLPINSVLNTFDFVVDSLHPTRIDRIFPFLENSVCIPYMGFHKTDEGVETTKDSGVHYLY